MSGDRGAVVPTQAEEGSGLERFLLAQDRGGIYETALAELRAGHKRGHWMWFVFPQLAGLGHSAMSRAYAIASLAEARAFLEHPILGARLRGCARALTEQSGRSAEEIFGVLDAVKLRSSMTLFAGAAAACDEPFAHVLDAYFAGQPDQATERLLSS
ncbi:MAG: DUF1810 domain-containing protein [Solirubrobacteraceae bacterium]